MTMVSCAHSSVILGIKALPVRVEALISSNAYSQNSFSLIGLADTAVREAGQRVLSALAAVGHKVAGNVLVSLSPAEIKKDGSGFDLPIAVALLGALGILPARKISQISFYGELGLDGQVRSVRGLIAHLLNAVERGQQWVVIPRANAAVAELFPQLKIILLDSLAELIAVLQGSDLKPSERLSVVNPDKIAQVSRVNEVCGQSLAKRALLIAASGQHNLLMIGPPGCGKSMLAERLNGILPELSLMERLETARIHSVLGENIERILNGTRPFRAPHYVISEVGLIGGGSPLKPGEISLAHNGVLFLDEFPEYRRSALESLRIPMESSRVSIVRSRERYIFPARFQLIAAMNPCPCGKLGVNGEKCTCSVFAVQKYLAKVSRPILDRIDIQVSLQAVKVSEVKGPAKDDFDYIAAVSSAREFAGRRSPQAVAYYSNKEITQYASLSLGAEKLLSDFCLKKSLSLRGYFKILKIARTVADLELSEAVKEAHIAEASSYRSLNLLSEFIK